MTNMVQTKLKAELICVGTELLLGQILNTNAQFISQQMAEVGVDLYYQTVVGDNMDRLKSVINTALSRSNVLIFTGGLGPTQDDLTKESIAEAFGWSLDRHEPALKKINDLFTKRDLPVPPGNEKQADYFSGGTILENEVGFAIGCAIQHEEIRIVVLPGPPSELKPMVVNHLNPWLKKQLGDANQLYSRTMRFAGIGESQVAFSLQDLIQNQTDPTIAPYAHDGEVAIRLSTKAKDLISAEMKFVPIIENIESRLKHYLYAYEDVSLEQALVRQLIISGLNLSTAESCSGGLLGDLLTNVSGVSVVYKGGFVTYSNEAKMLQLGVPAELLEGNDAPGAISKETAIAMAEGARQTMGTEIGLSITGVAGPESIEGKTPGMVYVAVALPDGKVIAEAYQSPGNRPTIKRRAAKRALFIAWRELKKGGWIEQ